MNILSKFQLPSYSGLGLTVQCLEDISTNHDLLTYLNQLIMEVIVEQSRLTGSVNKDEYKVEKDYTYWTKGIIQSPGGVCNFFIYTI